MKCDELKVYSFYVPVEDDSELHNEARKFYSKDEVDDAIAKLKAIVITDNSSVIARLEQQLRKTQRALWMARSFIMTLLQRDFQRLAYQCNSTEYKKNLLEKRNRFYDLSVKFSAKAKEYE